MAELGKKLGKLSLAILENFVEGVLGKKFVDELRSPTDRALAMDAALVNSEQRFAAEFSDKAFAERMFNGVSENNIGLFLDAIEHFYSHPAGSNFQATLNQVISESFPEVDRGLIPSAAKLYSDILTEELALADPAFRENVRALAELHSVDILRRVEVLLSRRETARIENTIFRSQHQLPQPPADFTGREEIIAQLLQDFKTHKGAAISGLTGMGGVGKTALGLVVAHKLSEEYPEAQIFLDLKGTTNTPLSAPDIMRHVILSFEPTMDLRTLDENGLANTYRTILNNKKALLFHDNARSADQISPLIPPDTCALLVTSRWTFPVTGLKNYALEVMEKEDAEKFLLELCPRISEHATELAKACAYLPLALRIAGSFLLVNAGWPVEEYVKQLNDRKTRLTAFTQSHKDAELKTEPDLLAAFELSYNQLEEKDQKRWRVLGVFPTSFAISAAQALWDLEENETRKVLSLLCRHSLLDYEETTGRYSLHDLLADYACAQMAQDEEMMARIAHADHYSDVLGDMNQMYLKGGENILPALRLYDNEWTNIDAGQKTAVLYLEENKKSAQACSFFAGQGSINDLRLLARDRIKWLEDGLRASEVLQDKGAQASHLNNLGLAYSNLDEVNKAIDYYEQVLVIAREIGDRRSEGAALGNLGIAYRNLGDYRKAIEFYEQRLVIAREIGDRRGEGNALGNLGSAYFMLCEYAMADNYYSQRIIIAQEIGDKRGEGNAFWGFAICKKQAGDISGAREMFQKALGIFKEIESPSAATIQQMLDELDQADPPP